MDKVQKNNVDVNAKVIQVIVTHHCRGIGTFQDCCRIVTGYHSLDGELLAERDPCATNDGRIIALQGKLDKVTKQLEVATAVNNLTKPNPALENVLAKLRSYIQYCNQRVRRDIPILICDDNGATSQLTFDDLRRWVESENPRTPACQLGKECPTPMRECPECAKEYLASQKPDALIRLLLRWFYCYHRAVDGHASDAGDKHIKPYFLPVYKATDELLGPMRDAGTLDDATCLEMGQVSVDDATRKESEVKP